jgi:ribonuclease D
MSMIQSADELAAFCERLKQEEFVAVDTEFLRDKTYWPLLCLIQVAARGEARAIDPLAPGMDLAPFVALLADRGLLKVFHAARQDIEIFFHLTGAIPAPLFDSQVAAMVCGFGDAVSYETLAGKLAGARIDKSHRFTDWSARPLTEKQLAYALADVIHLRTIYEKLAQRLQRTARAGWVDEEMAVLTNPDTYRLDPEFAWQRLKPRSGSPRFLAVLRELAAWRESEAQRKNLPRNRILRDEALLEVAAQLPRSPAEMARSRSLSRGIVEGPIGEAVLAAVGRGLEVAAHDAPTLPDRPEIPPGRGPLVELLKVLLKAKCESHHVAQKLVANVADLELIAAHDQADVLALHGWRREVFGEDALALKQGRIALAAERDQIRIVRLDQGAEPGTEAAADSAAVKEKRTA